MEFILFIFLLLKLSQSSGEGLPYMTSDAEEISGKCFDYIIVGGGTTGCPLAATLSEKYSVLLVERGGSPYGDPMVEDKHYYGFPLLQTDEFTSIAQSFVSEDGVQNHRGRVLGGSSAINGGFYSRARKEFVTKNGWDDGLVKYAYEWVESKIVSTPMLTEWQFVVQFGLLEAGILPYNGFSLEHVEGTKIGASLYDNFGKRHSSADLLQAGNPANITVLLNATVKSVIFHKEGDSNQHRAQGIKFINSHNNTNRIFKAHLNKPDNSSSQGDVILSAGTLGSPQILLLSGIGSRQHLESFNISIITELDNVGQGMQDNPSIALLADEIPHQRPPEPPQVVGIADNYKFIIEAGAIPLSNNETRMPIAAKLAFPDSKGKLKLNSTDPRQNPLVKFNYLSTDNDLDECTKMVELLEHVTRSQSVSMFLGNVPKSSLVSSPDELRKTCKNNVRTYYHNHGGCLVESVVDKDYKVYGVQGLRVIDGSTFNESPGTNPMATLLMLGRYQGIKILDERNHDHN
ncbi:hypothetical protein ACFE04_024464 [Oxalis oulophora]